MAGQKTAIGMLPQAGQPIVKPIFFGSRFSATKSFLSFVFGVC
jgi:hypothetical protein